MTIGRRLDPVLLGAILALAAPIAAAERPISRIQFEERQPSSGIDFVLDNGTTPNKEVIDGVLGGAALFDFDNDGRLDVFFTNGARGFSCESWTWPR